MKALLLCLPLLSSLASAQTTEGNVPFVRFFNDDHIPGTMESLSQEWLVWDSPLFERPVPFHLKGVLEVTMKSTEPKSKARHEAVVRMTNGDVIHGQLAGLSDSAVTLETWFGGKLSLNRLMIQSIKMMALPDYLYWGPDGIDGWTLSDEESWIYQNGAFKSQGNGGISRDLKLPEEFSLTWNVEWRNGLNMRLYFCSEDVSQSIPGSGYELNFNNRNLTLRNCRTGNSMGFSRNAIKLAENEKATIELRASRKTKTFVLLVDDEVIEVWKDNLDAEKGTGIHFVARREWPVQISRIAVAKWDGHVDEVPERRPEMFQHLGRMMDVPETPKEETPPDGDRMELKNGDSITGVVMGVEDERLHVKTPFRDVKLPLELLKSISLPKADLERSKREKGDIRAWFPNGNSIVFRLESVGDGTISGSSQNFGNATFKTEAFNRVEFNIYNPEMDSLRMAAGW